MRSRTVHALALATAVLANAGCSSGADPTAPQADDVTALLSVQPVGGSVDTSVGATVVVTFDHAIAEGMEKYADLHEGTVAGPVVAGAWSRSVDGATLTFTPSVPLKPATTYVIHLGGDMMDENGHVVDLEMHGDMMGGQWATQSMMTGGMGMGSGSMGSHMGTGWQHPDNGSYGMVFTFTTAAS
jgi:hypothetical protein